MTAPTILRQCNTDNLRRAETHASSIAKSHPEIGEKVEALRNARGRDQMHTESARLAALADLLEAIDAAISPSGAADLLDEASKAELQRTAQLEDVDFRASDNKEELKEEIREERTEEHDELDDLRDLDVIGPELDAKLSEAGYATPDDLRAASDEDLLAVEGIGKAKLKSIRAQL